jgi:hypothetical protein
MTLYEFKVIPAPRRGEKARGLKTTEERFALALTNAMNLLGREGWDYVRADTLPVDERSGFTGTKTSFQNMLVFRRVLVTSGAAVSPAFASLSADAVNASLSEGASAPKLGSAETTTGSAPAVGPAIAVPSALVEQSTK